MVTNAEGLVGEKQVWGKPSAWCDYSGLVGDEKAGVTMIGDPRNSGHPARFHVRGTGLLAVNPFGVSAFTAEPSQSGAQIVEPGGSLHFRYRTIIHAGDAKSNRYTGALREVRRGEVSPQTPRSIFDKERFS